MQTATITLTITRESRAVAQYVFDQPTACVIGRATDCDIRLTEGTDRDFVSRHHCRLELDPPRVTVRDLGSLNGTFLNGKKLGRTPRGYVLGPLAEQPVVDGDEVRVNDTVLRIGIVEAVPDPESAGAKHGNGQSEPRTIP